jgi:hypothetical protein
VYSSSFLRFLHCVEFCRKIKSPPALVPAGFGFFDLSGRLVQAMAVRRHGCPMMVVMTVMAAVVHLFKK